jgi:hypothetical protein
MMTNEETLPQDLTEILNSPEFDDESGIVIDAVSFDTNLTLDFSFRYYYYDQVLPKRWRLTVSQVKEERIVRDWTTSQIALYSQHPRLLEYIDTYAELYFSGTST